MIHPEVQRYFDEAVCKVAHAHQTEPEEILNAMRLTGFEDFRELMEVEGFEDLMHGFSRENYCRPSVDK